MKKMPKILMIICCVFFALTVVSVVLHNNLLIIVFLLLHSLCIMGFIYYTVFYKDPDFDSQRLYNSLQQANARFEEYRAEATQSIATKDETISRLCTELEAFKKNS
ncbi:MAG: hypothetical protein K6F86_13110 [Lachnospiraceae bacterium]|nr:hypothetical protein [Lachnospiraceae bacterium]